MSLDSSKDEKYLEKNGVEIVTSDRLIIEIAENELGFVEGDVSKMTDSPYPEVRASVVPEVDLNTNLNHWRSWFLTSVFVIVFAGVNQFFSLRYPTITIGFVVAQVLSYPIGKALEKLPDWRVGIDFFNLNPGPFTKQEHALLTIIVSLTASTSYAMYILNAQTNFYNQDVPIGYQILLVFSTQLLGYGVSGMTRRWIVYPAAMIWPQTLITCTVFSTLAKTSISEHLHVSRISWSRYRMFTVVGIFSFVWYWFPGFIFKALSYFNWVCWIAPHNIVVNQIFGINSGLGVIPITFDWTQITQALSVSPLATPFWVAANTYGAVFIFFVILLPILYYTNHWDAKYMPMMSSSTYDNRQKSYNVSRILTPDLKIDHAEYEKYSPLFIPYSYLLNYATNFAAVIAIFTHTALYQGKDVIKKFKDAKHGGEDIHKRMMNGFKEVPDWWYAIVFAISVGLAFATICGYLEITRTPAWGLVIALGIAFIGFIPQGLLEGITNQHVGLNVVTEIVGGYVFPGNPMANMMIKLYGFIPMRQGLDFSRDLKLGQYMKIPPRILFVFQIYGTILACLVNVGVQQWMRFNVKNICKPGEEFSCPNGKVIYFASISFSLAKELFSPGKRYNAILYFFIIGLVFPIFTYILYRKYPKKWYGRINGPVFFTGSGNIPPSTLYNYSLYFATCFVFNYYIKKYYKAFHTKYNYVISAAFDAGVAFSAVIIFLCVTYPGGKLNWWGNSVYQKTLDMESAPFYKLKPGETFGPKKW